jgi:hypothetical protein
VQRRTPRERNGGPPLRRSVRALRGGPIFHQRRPRVGGGLPRCVQRRNILQRDRPHWSRSVRIVSSDPWPHLRRLKRSNRVRRVRKRFYPKYRGLWIVHSHSYKNVRGRRRKHRWYHVHIVPRRSFWAGAEWFERVHGLWSWSIRVRAKVNCLYVLRSGYSYRNRLHCFGVHILRGWGCARRSFHCLLCVRRWNAQVAQRNGKRVRMPTVHIRQDCRFGIGSVLGVLRWFSA